MGKNWVTFAQSQFWALRLAQFLLIFCPSVKPVEMDLYHFQFHYPLLIRWLKEKSHCLQIGGKIWANEAHFEKLVNICSFSRSFFALPCRFVINLNMFYEFCSSKGPITEEWSDKVHMTVRTGIKCKFYQNDLIGKNVTQFFTHILPTKSPSVSLVNPGNCWDIGDPCNYSDRKKSYSKRIKFL